MLVNNIFSVGYFFECEHFDRSHLQILLCDSENKNKMQFYPNKWLNFHIICKFVICLLLVCPVHLFPWPKETNPNSVNLSTENDRIETATLPTVVETLNSNKINVNPKNGHDKPVFDGSFTVNYRSKRSMESEKSATDRTVDNKNYKEYQKSSRQLNIPFMAVPSNWIATFDPTNAVILTNNVPLRIWAIGNVAKFPTFIENVVQRIQSYYSTYKYHDLSRPAAHAIINPQYHQHETTNIETMVNNDSNDSYDGIEISENDPIDEESTEFETETASTLDYFDTTTDINYYNDLSDETTETTETTETNDSIEVFK